MQENLQTWCSHFKKQAMHSLTMNKYFYKTQQSQELAPPCREHVDGLLSGCTIPVPVKDSEVPAACHAEGPVHAAVHCAGALPPHPDLVVGSAAGLPHIDDRPAA